MANRALIYCRQSLTRDEDDSLSLDFQERESRLMAARNGWMVVEPPILDPDVKGWDPLRPGIQDLLRRVESDRAEIVIVYAMSRFARDYILQETIWRQLRERGARLVSVHEPHAEDDLVRGILGVVSQAERRRMGAFLKSAFAERVRRGLPHGGRIPFGYQKGEDGRLLPDPEDAPWALRMVERLEDGWSLWRVSAWMAERHPVRVWNAKAVRKVVCSPPIAGGLKSGETVVWDTHEPLIDRDRWERLSQLLDRRRPARRKTEPSWLEDLILCGCGARMYLITDRANFDPPRRQFRCANGGTYQNYGLSKYQRPDCTFSPKSIMLHLAVSGTIEALHQDLAQLLDWEAAFLAVERAYLAQEGASLIERKRLERDLRKAEAERERLLVLYRRGSLDVERWETSDAEVAVRIDQLTDDLNSLPEPPDPARVRQNWNHLQGIRDAVDRIAPVAPEELRRVLIAAGAKVQRTSNGVRIAWPEELRLFIQSDW